MRMNLTVGLQVPDWHQLSDGGENRDTSDDPAPSLRNKFGHELKKCKKQ